MPTGWDEWGARLRQELGDLGKDSILVVATVVEREDEPRGRWWKRSRREPTPDEHLIQLAGGPDGSLLALITGSRLVGGPHDVEHAAHDAVVAAGWTQPGDDEHPYDGGGDYARWSRLRDGAALDSLVQAAMVALHALGARPDQEWRWNRVQ